MVSASRGGGMAEAGRGRARSLGAGWRAPRPPPRRGTADRATESHQLRAGGSTYVGAHRESSRRVRRLAYHPGRARVRGRGDPPGAGGAGRGGGVVVVEGTLDIVREEEAGDDASPRTARRRRRTPRRPRRRRTRRRSGRADDDAARRGRETRRGASGRESRRGVTAIREAREAHQTTRARAEGTRARWPTGRRRNPKPGDVVAGGNPRSTRGAGANSL